MEYVRAKFGPYPSLANVTFHYSTKEVEYKRRKAKVHITTQGSTKNCIKIAFKYSNAGGGGLALFKLCISLGKVMISEV